MVHIKNVKKGEKGKKSRERVIPLEQEKKDVAPSSSRNAQAFAQLNERERQKFFVNPTASTSEKRKTSARGDGESEGVLSPLNIAQLDPPMQAIFTGKSPASDTDSTLTSLASVENRLSTSPHPESSCDLLREQAVEKKRMKRRRMDSSTNSVASSRSLDDLEGQKPKRRVKRDRLQSLKDQLERDQSQLLEQQEVRQFSEFLKEKYDVDIPIEKKGKRPRIETISSILGKARRQKPELKAISEASLRKASDAYRATLGKEKEPLNPYLDMTLHEIYHEDFLSPTYQDTTPCPAEHAQEGLFYVNDDPSIDTATTKKEIHSLRSSITAMEKHKEKDEKTGKSKHALHMTDKLHEEKDEEGKSLYALAKNKELHAERDEDGKSLRALAWNKELHAERDEDGKSLHTLKRHEAKNNEGKSLHALAMLKTFHAKKDPVTNKSLNAQRAGRKGRKAHARNADGKSLRVLTMLETKRKKQEDQELLDYIGFDEGEELANTHPDTSQNFLFDLDTVQNNGQPSSSDASKNIDPDLL